LDADPHFVLTAGALHQARFALGGLIVDDKQMVRNLDISRGLIVAEAVMMGLAPQIGRQQAHDVVYDACRTVNEQGGTLAEVLARDELVTRHFDHAAIQRLTDRPTISAWRPRWLIACSRIPPPPVNRPARSREISFPRSACLEKNDVPNPLECRGHDDPAGHDERLRAGIPDPSR
jgi:Adenylosuccinate lyase C-terminus